MYFSKLKHKRTNGQILGKNTHGDIHKSLLIWLLSYYLYLLLFKIFTKTFIGWCQYAIMIIFVHILVFTFDP